MNKIIIFFSFLTTFLLASSDTCYSIQLLSSQKKINKASLPEGARVFKIGNYYTARYGCVEHKSEIAPILNKFKESYPNAYITLTYKWRFENNVENKVKNSDINVKTYEAKHQKNNLFEAISSIFSLKNDNTDKYVKRSIGNVNVVSGNMNNASDSISGKCYSVQLAIAPNNLNSNIFPIGTEIIKKYGLYSAVYGCFSDINKAKSALYNLSKKFPSAIIVTLQENKFQYKNSFPPLENEEKFTQNNNSQNISYKKETNTNTLSFRKKRFFNITALHSPKCPSYIEKNIVSCNNGCKYKNRKWENIDLNAVKDYVRSNLAGKINQQFLVPSQLNSNTEKFFNFTSEQVLNYYISAHMNVVSGQEGKINNETKLLDHKSLRISGGIKYKNYFMPNWYFYTNDALALYMSESKEKLDPEIKELYLKSYNLFDNQANFLIGRKYLKDERGWYYKTSLDTLGVFNSHDLFLYELYAGTRLTSSNTTHDPSEVSVNLKNTNFIIGHLSYEYLINHKVEGFYVLENKTNKNLNWIGVRLQGEMPLNNINILKYWLDVAHMSGEYNNSSAKGLGFDVGGKYSFTNYNSAVAASLAYGSGGGNMFLQPDFTNNRSNYLSKSVSFKYYGEFLDPELSNIWITSFYLMHNFYGDENKTAILAFHNYMQDKASSKQYSATNYTYRPNGKSTYLGNEIDFILRYNWFENSYWRFIIGYFMGGQAFDKTSKKDGFNAQVYYNYIW